MTKMRRTIEKSFHLRNTIAELRNMLGTEILCIWKQWKRIDMNSYPPHSTACATLSRRPVSPPGGELSLLMGRKREREESGA